MDDTRRRLARCFTAVFEGLDERAAESASAETVASWDSIAVVTLIGLVEEEFRIQIAPGDIGRLTSFAAFHEYVQARALAA